MAQIQAHRGTQCPSKHRSGKEEYGGIACSRRYFKLITVAEVALKINFPLAKRCFMSGQCAHLPLVFFFFSVFRFCLPCVSEADIAVALLTQFNQAHQWDQIKIFGFVWCIDWVPYQLHASYTVGLLNRLRLWRSRLYLPKSVAQRFARKCLYYKDSMNLGFSGFSFILFYFFRFLFPYGARTMDNFVRLKRNGWVVLDYGLTPLMKLRVDFSDNLYCFELGISLWFSGW